MPDATPQARIAEALARRGPGTTSVWPPIAPGASWAENEGALASALAKTWQDILARLHVGAAQ